MKPKVFVIIVNWNGEVDTISCLTSLSQVVYEAMHVLISDNGSKPESLSAIRSWINLNVGVDSDRGISSCRIIENRINLGFTGANTSGIKVAFENGADYILFLNNDTTVESGFLSTMVCVAESQERYGIIGSKILTREKDDQSGRFKIWSLGGYGWKRGVPINLCGGTLDSSSLAGVRENAMINGCCMLIKRAVIEEIGVQDDDLFFGMDDAEFSLRAWRRGWINAIALDAKIYHIGSHAVEAGSPLQAYYLFRNMLFFRVKYFSWHENVVFFMNYWVRYVLIGCSIRAIAGRGVVNRGVWLGIRDFFAGNMGECRHKAIMKS